MKARLAFRFGFWLLSASTVALVSTLLVSPFWLYHQFDKEIPIAILSPFQEASNHYLITLTNTKDCTVQYFPIHSEQIQIDASFVKWKSWLTALGADPVFQFDRLSERRINLTELESEQHSSGRPISGRPISGRPIPASTRRSFDLRTETVLPVFSNQALDGSGSFFIDSQYGSSVYVTIDSRLNYILYMSEDGLFVRSEPKPPLLDKDGNLVVNIDKACSANNSHWRKFLSWLNAGLI
ncbi:hypothetical protein [Agaribacter flavus]|uniref:Transmembrane protein n=1 Tax=Agaribacter flavus TaxID=1902781 RepID=A0ABV7FSB0_9ALTE